MGDFLVLQWDSLLPWTLGLCHGCWWLVRAIAHAVGLCVRAGRRACVGFVVFRRCVCQSACVALCHAHSGHGPFCAVFLNLVSFGDLEEEGAIPASFEIALQNRTVPKCIKKFSVHKFSSTNPSRGYARLFTKGRTPFLQDPLLHLLGPPQ